MMLRRGAGDGIRQRDAEVGIAKSGGPGVCWRERGDCRGSERRSVRVATLVRDKLKGLQMEYIWKSFCYTLCIFLPAGLLGKVLYDEAVTGKETFIWRLAKCRVWTVRYLLLLIFTNSLFSLGNPAMLI